MRAARLSMSEGHWFTPSVFVYDVAVYDTVLYPTDLKWNIFESLTEEQIDRKVEALEAYSSQAVTGPHPVERDQADGTRHRRGTPGGVGRAVRPRPRRARLNDAAT